MLSLLSKDDAKRVSSFLVDQGYTETNLRDTLALKELPASRLRNMPRLLDVTREANCINALVRWFWIGVPQPADEIKTRVPDWFVTLALECGLLQRRGDQLYSEAMLSPTEGFLFAADHTAKVDSANCDLVLWPNPTSRLLSRFTVRRHSRATLDLGTGSGIQAVLASHHSDSVIATDLNPRAVEFASFTARLNGVENVEVLQGDGFSPVAGRTFDLITSNPPFFITPNEDYLFCENPLELDHLCRKFVREAPQHLNEGGYYQMLCEWAGIEGQNWQERLSEWFEGTGCDVWVLKGYSQNPREYAEEHIRSLISSPAEDANRYEKYMSYYREHKLTAIHGGLVAMHRRSGRNWMLMEEVQHMPKNVFGEMVAATFQRRELLLGQDGDDQLLELKPRLSADVRLEQTFQPQGGEWKLDGLTLRMAEGLNPLLGVQPIVAEFLIGCDGSRPLREVIAGFGTKVDAPLEQVQRECLDAVRKLIERGFLLC